MEFGLKFLLIKLHVRIVAGYSMIIVNQIEGKCIKGCYRSYFFAYFSAWTHSNHWVSIVLESAIQLPSLKTNKDREEVDLC